jgi:hypothetical protein
MKIMGLITASVFGLSAYGGTFGHTGETNCTGKVNGIPITLTIQWGTVSEGSSNLPPYSINQTQAAIVTTEFQGNTTLEDVIFQESGGTTRCEWWNKTSAKLSLNQPQPVLQLELVKSWDHSGCGRYPTGAFVKDLQANDNVLPIGLSCQ